MKNFIVNISAITIILLTVSCKKEDSPEPSTISYEELLVNEWIPVKQIYKLYENDVLVHEHSYDEFIDKSNVIIKEDGTYEDDWTQGTWELDDNNIIFHNEYNLNGHGSEIILLNKKFLAIQLKIVTTSKHFTRVAVHQTYFKKK